MPTITYIEADGREYQIEVPVGNSVMQGAVNNNIEGILAECGGNCSCGTCHCYVDENWLEVVGEPDEDEEDMLDTVIDPKPNSRLSCQIKVTEAMGGLVVRLPISQY